MKEIQTDYETREVTRVEEREVTDYETAAVEREVTLCDVCGREVPNGEETTLRPGGADPGLSDAEINRRLGAVAFVVPAVIEGDAAPVVIQGDVDYEEIEYLHHGLPVANEDGNARPGINYRADEDFESVVHIKDALKIAVDARDGTDDSATADDRPVHVCPGCMADMREPPEPGAVAAPTADAAREAAADRDRPKTTLELMEDLNEAWADVATDVWDETAALIDAAGPAFIPGFLFGYAVFIALSVSGVIGMICAALLITAGIYVLHRTLADYFAGPPRTRHP